MTSFSGNILSHVLARSIFSSSDRTDFLAYATPVYCQDINGVKADSVTIIDPKVDSSNVLGSNKYEVDLNQKFSATIKIPLEDIMTAKVDVYKLCESFFAGKFRVQISNSIKQSIETNKDTLADLTANYTSTDLATFVGNVLAYYQVEDVGDKQRIYRYSNGAPIVYTNSINQFDAEIPFKGINQEETDMMSIYMSTFSDINSNQPALYYFEKPTIIFPTVAMLKKFYTEVVKKNIDKRVALEKFEIGYAGNTTTLTNPVVGKNNNFALCYTTPRISTIASTSEFAVLVKCEIDYGVYPIGTTPIFEVTT